MYDNNNVLVEEDDWMSYLTMVAHAINTQPLVCCPIFPGISTTTSSSSSSSSSWPYSPSLPSSQLSPQLSPSQRSIPLKQTVTLPPSPHFCAWVDMKEFIAYDDDTMNDAIKTHESVLWGLFTCYAFNASMVRSAPSQIAQSNLIAPSQIAQSKLLTSPMPSHPSSSSFSPIPSMTTPTTPIPPPPLTTTTTTTTTSPIVRFPPIHSRGSPMKYEKRLLGVDHCWQLLEDLRLVPTLLNTIRFQHLLTIITTSTVVVDTIASGNTTTGSSHRLTPAHTSTSHSMNVHPLHHPREMEGSLPVEEYKPNHIHHPHLHAPYHPHHENKYKGGGTPSTSSTSMPGLLCFREFVKLLMMVADVGYSKTHPLDRNAQFHELMHRIYSSNHYKRLLLLGVGVVADEDRVAEGVDMRGDVMIDRDVNMGGGMNQRREGDRQGTHLGSEMDVVALSQPLSSDQSNLYQSNPVELSQSLAMMKAINQPDNDDYGDDDTQPLIEHPSSVATPNNNHHHQYNNDNHQSNIAINNNNNNTNINATTTTATYSPKLLLSPEERVVLSRLRFTIDPYATRYVPPYPP